MYKKGMTPHNKGDSYVHANFRNKPSHSDHVTPIYDPLNPKISNFAQPKKNSVWSCGVDL